MQRVQQKYKLRKRHIFLACFDNALACAKKPAHLRKKKRPTEKFWEAKLSSEETKEKQVLNV